jgi:hypothetical protein
VRSRLAATLAALGLLAGCDGGLQLEGRVVRADGSPSADTPVYFYLDGKPDERHPVFTTDADGRFGTARVDCPCDFDIELVALAPGQGVARLRTTHRAVEKNPQVVLTLDPAATDATPAPTPGEGR